MYSSDVVFHQSVYIVRVVFCYSYLLVKPFSLAKGCVKVVLILAELIKRMYMCTCKLAISNKHLM